MYLLAVPVHVNKIEIDPNEGRYIHHVFNPGKTIHLNCRAAGNPQPHYRWTFSPKGDNLTEQILATEPSYTITDAQEGNDGIYKCTVYNTINQKLHSDSKKVYIRINGE